MIPQITSLRHIRPTRFRLSCKNGSCRHITYTGAHVLVLTFCTTITREVGIGLWVRIQKAYKLKKIPISASLKNITLFSDKINQYHFTVSTRFGFYISAATSSPNLFFLSLNFHKMKLQFLFQIFFTTPIEAT